MGGGGQERPGLRPVRPGSRTGMLRRAPAPGSGRERGPEVWGRAVCTPDVRRCPGGHTAALAHARGGEGELAPVWAPPPRRLGKPALLWPRPGAGAVPCGDRPVTSVKDRLRSWRSAHFRLDYSSSLACPESFWVSLGLFFEETEDYIFYREQAVFLIFVSFFRCNFYLCSNPNLLVWVRPGGIAHVPPASRGTVGPCSGAGAAPPGGPADQPDEAHPRPSR